MYATKRIFYELPAHLVCFSVILWFRTYSMCISIATKRNVTFFKDDIYSYNYLRHSLIQKPTVFKIQAIPSICLIRSPRVNTHQAAATPNPAAAPIAEPRKPLADL